MAEQAFPTSQRVLKIGWVGTGPFSFYGDYMRVINQPEPNPLNMRVTHIWGDDYSKNYRGNPDWVKKMVDGWNTGRQSPASLAERYSIPNVCKDFHEMVDDIDAAMIMDFDRSEELAEPFIKKGMPIFLCSPVAINVPTCERILDLAEKSGSAVYTGSFTVGMPQNKIFYSRVHEKNLATLFASTYCGFFTSYANDGLEPVHMIVKGKPRLVSMHGWDGSKGFDPHGIPLSRIHVEYEPVDDNPPVQAVLNLGGNDRAMETYRAYYRDHSVLESSAHWTQYPMNFGEFLREVQQVFTTNKSIETRDDIIDKLKIIIAAYKSAREGGRPILVNEVGDYNMPTIRIEKWDVIPG